jgi:hypothetical protein
VGVAAGVEVGAVGAAPGRCGLDAGVVGWLGVVGVGGVRGDDDRGDLGVAGDPDGGFGGEGAAPVQVRRRAAGGAVERVVQG